MGVGWVGEKAIGFLVFQESESSLGWEFKLFFQAAKQLSHGRKIVLYIGCFAYSLLPLLPPLLSSVFPLLPY